MNKRYGSNHYGKKYFGTLMALGLFAGLGLVAINTASAQEKPDLSPPKVLMITQEMLKPGMSGMPHQKSESAFVEAMKNAKSPDHYFAMSSISGPGRALFFIPFDSFADMEKSYAQMMQDKTLATAFDEAQQADGKLLKSSATMIFVYRPDMSVAPNEDVSRMRYWEITVIEIKPGHAAEWQELSKMHNEIYGKLPHEHFAMWEEWYGNDGGEYIATTPLKSLAEVDAHKMDAHKAWAAVSADTKKKMGDLEANCFKSIHTNLYAVNPKMSYVWDQWKTADPGFWGQQ